MKVLVVAYSSHPYLGSEPGVGWEGICRAAKEHQVFVLTDSHHREGWERGFREGKIPQNVAVRFLRNHKPFSENRVIAQFQSWLRYRSFNRLVLSEALKWHAEAEFDICHQVNIASWRLPSPLWQLPIPFIWGPLGGAGWIPLPFRSMLSRKARLFEMARDVNTFLAKRSRSLRKALERSTVVIAANEETEQFLRPLRSPLPMPRIPVASLGSERIAGIRRVAIPRPADMSLRIFAGGNVEGRKGFSLALRALGRAAAAGVRFHYIIAGGGPETESLPRLARELGIEDSVEMHPGFSGQAYADVLSGSDIYLLPSFRETLGITMVEAMIAGCYAIVADISAQGEIVRMAGGTAVATKSPEQVVEGLAEAIIWCDRNREAMAEAACIAGRRVEEFFNSEHHDRTLLEIYQNVGGGSPRIRSQRSELLF